MLSQVTSQIEQLKITQMEKKLELKEASTRRKILALKHKLFAGRNSTSPSQQHSNTIQQSSSQSLSQSQATHLQFDELIPAAKNCVYPPNMVSHSAGASVQMFTTTASSAVTPHSECNSKSLISLNQTLSSKNEGIQLLSPKTDNDMSKTTHIVTQVDISSPNSENLLESASKVETPKRQMIWNVKDPSSLQVHSPPVKLTLPEEVKETEYMTAVQKQKARVSKIRRCIVAATLIQRAWRAHKNLSVA